MSQGREAEGQRLGLAGPDSWACLSSELQHAGLDSLSCLQEPVGLVTTRRLSFVHEAAGQRVSVAPVCQAPQVFSHGGRVQAMAVNH